MSSHTSAPLPPAASCRHISPYPEPVWHPGALDTHPAAAASAASSPPFLCLSLQAADGWSPAPETGHPPGPSPSPHEPPAGPDTRNIQLLSENTASVSVKILSRHGSSLSGSWVTKTRAVIRSALKELKKTGYWQANPYIDNNKLLLTVQNQYVETKCLSRQNIVDLYTI